MKRQITKTIESCLECEHLRETGGWSAHFHYCPRLHKTTIEQFDDRSSEAAKKQMEEWFKECPVWKEIE